MQGGATVSSSSENSTPARGVRALAALIVLLLACSGDPQREREPSGPGSGGFGNAPVAGAGQGASFAGSFGNSAGAGRSGSPVQVADAGPAPGQTCATASLGVDLLPVHLAFAFDVSGSMGKGDEPWHDKSLKWDPVVLATRTFFEDPASAGLRASLTFFPEGGDDDERCAQEPYEAPDVEMTELPSEAFGEAIDAITPKAEDDWRGGTPTAFVVRGTHAFVESYREDNLGRFAIVLVTDGYPQGCDDEDDTIEAVVTEVQAARGTDIATYVIGVANPPIDDAPDTVSNLHAIAEAGGTEQAFLIDTGDPAQTASAFNAAVDRIRETAITCTLAIPDPPEGRNFDKENVAVHYRSGGTDDMPLVYDPSCAKTDGWHYDDPAEPHAIELCETTCDTVQADPQAELEVEFACERLLSVD